MSDLLFLIAIGLLAIGADAYLLYRVRRAMFRAEAEEARDLVTSSLKQANLPTSHLDVTAALRRKEKTDD